MQAAEIVGTLAEDVRSSASLYGKYMTAAVTKVRAGECTVGLCTLCKLQQPGQGHAACILAPLCCCHAVTLHRGSGSVCLGSTSVCPGLQMAVRKLSSFTAVILIAGQRVLPEGV